MEVWGFAVDITIKLGCIDGSGAQARFLVVDDSLLARLTVKQALEHLNGDCEVHLAANGDEALTAVPPSPFDIVFMDLNMPGEDGFSAQIRRRHSDQSIVLLTANIQQKVKERAAESGLLFATCQRRQNSRSWGRLRALPTGDARRTAPWVTMTCLSPTAQDALGELFNLAVGQAGVLSEMWTVMLSVPMVQVCHRGKRLSRCRNRSRRAWPWSPRRCKVIGATRVWLADEHAVFGVSVAS